MQSSQERQERTEEDGQGATECMMACMETKIDRTTERVGTGGQF
jgi:hypothetical protein